MDRSVLKRRKKNHAVIFDIVLNIENLYSIGAIEEEIREAIFLYRSHEKSDEIVNKTFEIIDEIRDGLNFFDKLYDTLTAGKLPQTQIEIWMHWGDCASDAWEVYYQVL